MRSTLIVSILILKSVKRPQITKSSRFTTDPFDSRPEFLYIVYIYIYINLLEFLGVDEKIVRSSVRVIHVVKRDMDENWTRDGISIERNISRILLLPKL